MTARASRLRRFREWAWKGQALAALKTGAWNEVHRQQLQAASACHTLAWRTLGGLEPVSASTRPAVAKPLLRAGLQNCLPLLSPAHASLEELFSDTERQQAWLVLGLTSERLKAVYGWLLDDDASAKHETAADARLVLQTLLESLDAASGAIRKLVWRRARVLAVGLLLPVALLVALLLLVLPSEGADLGVGKPWHASSAYPGFVGSGAKPVKPAEGAFFATNDEVNPWWSIDLQSAKELGSVTIVNRADCCPDRAVPLALELSTDAQTWREVSRKTETFRTWTPKFSPTKARYVRLRALRRTLLHFKDVRIHAAASPK